MNFLLYSMVIRTLYQGSIYNLLKSNKRHEPAQSVDEMIDRDYTFYVSEGSIDLFQSSEAIKKRFFLLNRNLLNVSPLMISNTLHP
jgi:hypothetical protein